MSRVSGGAAMPCRRRLQSYVQFMETVFFSFPDLELSQGILDSKLIHDREIEAKNTGRLQKMPAFQII